ncbi:MAG: ABC transporter ATP-binding protein [Planctomycetaceae bacterium]|nr:ABC transporter ATP-binding protein [Planctomycetaceae bacterium]MCP4461691.1 ABC transporter ATP-binding protein [Planctomycetaceae bacterium]
MSANFVETNSLTKRYTEVTALDSCTLQISKGEVFGLLGPNGAGKTTLLRLIMGFLNPTSGSASIDGLDCYRDRVEAHKKVAYLPGDARLFRTMRGKDVLKFFAGVRTDTDLTRANQIAQRLELDLSRWVVFMSTGMRQKLALSVVMAVDSPLLILDEPTANLDPSVRGEIMEMVKEAKRAGRTVIFSSHVLPEVEDTCDRVGILRKGKLVHTQMLKDLKMQHRVHAVLRAGEAMLPVPDDLRDQISVVDQGDSKVLIETPGELSSILQWLANSPLQDVHVQPVGLRSVYDQFHRDESSELELPQS